MMTLEEKFHSFSKTNLPCPDHRGISIVFNDDLLKNFTIADNIILKLNFDISDSQKQPTSNLKFLGTFDNTEFYSLNLTNPHLHDFSKNEWIFNLNDGRFFQFTFNKFPETVVYVFETLVYYNHPLQNAI